MLSKAIRSHGLTPKQLSSKHQFQFQAANEHTVKKEKKGRHASQQKKSQGTNQLINFYQDPTQKDLYQNSSSSSTNSSQNSLDNKIQSIITQVKQEDSTNLAPHNIQSGTRSPTGYSKPYEYTYASRFTSTPSQQSLANSHGQQSHGNSRTASASKAAAPVSMLGPQRKQDIGKKTLVLDLDETLVHSSFKPIDNADIVLPVEIEGKMCYVYVLKRPYCEEFIQRMAIYYEIVMFTASLSKYAEPLFGKLDPTKCCNSLLYREHCTFYNGVFVKDLSKLGRKMEDVMIIDNSPSSYLFQPENSFPSINWYDDKADRDLLDYIPILERIANVKDVRDYLKLIVVNNKVDFEKANQLLGLQTQGGVSNGGAHIGQAEYGTPSKKQNEIYNNAGLNQMKTPSNLTKQSEHNTLSQLKQQFTTPMAHTSAIYSSDTSYSLSQSSQQQPHYQQQTLIKDTRTQSAKSLRTNSAVGKQPTDLANTNEIQNHMSSAGTTPLSKTHFSKDQLTLGCQHNTPASYTKINVVSSKNSANMQAQTQSASTNMQQLQANNTSAATNNIDSSMSKISSLQQSLELFKQQQIVSAKQSAQIEDLKKRTLINTWTSGSPTNNNSEMFQQTQLSMSSTQKSNQLMLKDANIQNKQYDRQNALSISNPSDLQLSIKDKSKVHSSASKVFLKPKNSVPNNRLTEELLEKENNKYGGLGSSAATTMNALSLSDQKYSDYMNSLQKQQQQNNSTTNKRTANSESKYKSSASNGPLASADTNIQHNYHTHSNLQQKDQNHDAGKRASSSKRPASAKDENKHSGSNGLSIKKPGKEMLLSSSLQRPQSTTASSNHHNPSSSNFGLKSTKNQTSSANQNQKMNLFNFLQTPDRHNNFESEQTKIQFSNKQHVQGSSASKPHQGQVSSTPSHKSQVSSCQQNKQRESSFSALQQKHIELRKNFANFLKNLEGTSNNLKACQAGKNSNNMSPTSQGINIAKTNTGPPMPSTNKFIQKIQTSSNSQFYCENLSNQNHQQKTMKMIGKQTSQPATHEFGAPAELQDRFMNTCKLNFDTKSPFTCMTQGKHMSQLSQPQTQLSQQQQTQQNYPAHSPINSIAMSMLRYTPGPASKE